jgi:hypothetical protein
MDERLARGVALFNEERFFDAHDAWEDLWNETSGPDRVFVQGLIQAAVGLYHRGNGNCRGARSQLSRSLAKLAGFTPGRHGLDTAGLVGRLRGCLAEAERCCREGRPPSPPPPAPVIRPLPAP